MNTRLVDKNPKHLLDTAHKMSLKCEDLLIFKTSHWIPGNRNRRIYTKKKTMAFAVQDQHHDTLFSLCNKIAATSIKATSFVAIEKNNH